MDTVQTDSQSGDKPRSSARDALGIFGTGATVFLIALLTGVAVARVLGASDRGLYAFLLLFGSFIVPFASFGFGASVLYYVGNKTYRLADIAFSCAFAGFLHGALAASVIWILWSNEMLGAVAREVHAGQMLAMLSLMPLQGATLALTPGIIGAARFSLSNRFTLLRRFVLSFFLVSLVIVGSFGLNGAICSIVVTEVVVFLGFIYALWREFRPRFLIDFTFLKKSYRYGLRAWIGVIATQLNVRVDQLFLSVWCSSSVLGNYAVATLIAELIWMLPNSFGPVLFTRLSGEKDEQSRRDLTGRMHRATFLTLALLALVVGGVGFTLIPFIFGESYNDAALILLFLLPGSVAYTSLKILSKYFGATGTPEKTSLALVVSLSVAVGLYIVLVPWLGGIGAAIASSFGYAIASVVAVFFYQRVVAPKKTHLFDVGFEDLLWTIRQTKAGLISRRA